MKSGASVTHGDKHREPIFSSRVPELQFLEEAAQGVEEQPKRQRYSRVLSGELGKQLLCPPKQMSRTTKAPIRWHELPEKELTDELKRDLQMVQLRSFLDPHSPSKPSKTRNYASRFQIGTVVEDPSEFYSARLTRKQRKRSLADEILADEKVRKYAKKRFAEIQHAKASGGKLHYRGRVKAKGVRRGRR